MAARSDINGSPISILAPLPSGPPPVPSIICVSCVCVYKMLIERHSSSVVVVVVAVAATGLGERGWDDMDSRDILLLLSVACFPTVHGEFGPSLVWIGKGSTEMYTLQKLSISV